MKDFVLELDRPRKLVFDFDAWDLITGKYASQKEGQEFDISQLKITAREVPFLAFAGMYWEDHELTEEQTKKMLNEQIRAGKCTILSILGIVGDAILVQSGLQKASVETDGKEKKAPGPEATIPGSRRKRK